MKVEEKDDSIIVSFEDRTGIRAKALYSIEALYYAASAIGFFIWAINTLTAIPVLSVFIFGASVVFTIAFWRYFIRVTLKESIQINDDGIVLSAVSKGQQKIAGYEASLIANLRFVGFVKPIDHPM